MSGNANDCASALCRTASQIGQFRSVQAFPVCEQPGSRLRPVNLAKVRLAHCRDEDDALGQAPVKAPQRIAGLSFAVSVLRPLCQLWQLRDFDRDPPGFIARE
jgi:hypothetical protein